MNLNNKKFVTRSNPSGLSSDATIFYYYENEETVTATYKGGEIIEGFIIGKRIGANRIELLYQCLTKDGTLKAGEAKGIISKNETDQLVLKYDWNWLNGDLLGGVSEYIEMD
jgi:hypothetical protein